ncbi:hypothetical protein ACLINR_004562 [Vibrio parahaemolyticus]|nr:hypothetical protein [Vibrio parahaemolyticus]
MIKVYIGSILSVVFLGVSVFFTLEYYLDTFSGGFSRNHSDWGNFGSYFNGVLSPVISTFSLIAVLFTVYMQKTLLISQKQQNTTLIMGNKRTEYVHMVNTQIECVRIDIEVCVKQLELEKELNDCTSSFFGKKRKMKSVEITNKYVREIAVRNHIIKSYFTILTWVHATPDSEIFEIHEEFVDKLKELIAKQQEINIPNKAFKTDSQRSAFSV